MRRINLSIILGIVAGAAIIVAAIVMEIRGDSPAVFFHPVAALIVLGGSIACSLIFSPASELWRIAKRTYYSVKYPKTDYLQTIRDIVRLSVGVTKDVMYLEKVEPTIKNVMFRDGLQLIIMGFKGDDIRRFLEVRRDQNEFSVNQCSVLYFNLAKLGPALGLVGTLLGLVVLLYYHMGGDNIEQVASSMGVALTATLYGVAFANLVFGPLSEYMQFVAEKGILLDTLIIEGTIMIKERKHPIFLAQALKSYIPREDFAAVDEIMKQELAGTKLTPDGERVAA